MTIGYYRFPTIHQDTIVFVSEDDLWSVPRTGGVARRLTSNLGAVNYPALSPDGAWMAFVGREEGMPEVYLMPAEGGGARRMTYLSSRCQVLGWSPDARSILFASTYGQFDSHIYTIFQIGIDVYNGAVTSVPVGPAQSIAYGPDGQVVIGRNTGDPARWKRYRGGTAGNLWIDRSGDGQFERLLAEVKGQIASPMWLGSGADARVYFVSDHEGVGNIYSCRLDGGNLRRHTDSEEFYTRNPSTDGRRIVYHVGADLYVYDPTSGHSEQVEVSYRSPRVQRNRKFVSAVPYLDHARLTPTGDALAVTTRGKAFAFFNHEGPVIQVGKRDGVRYRLPNWLNDGERLVLVDDAAGEEELVIFGADPIAEPQRLTALDIGRPVAIKVSPTEDKIAVSNHRQELLLIDLESAALEMVDRSEWRPIAGFDWSPDGRWLAYGFATSLSATEIRLYHLPEPTSAEVKAGQDTAAVSTDGLGAALPNPIAVTRPVLHDIMPSFDPGGKYLYFLSYREFNPVYDNLHFDLGFPWGMRPYLITLRSDLPNPFVPRPGGEDEESADHDEEDHGPGEAEEPDDSSDDEDQDGELLDELDESDIEEEYGDDEFDDEFNEDEESEDDPRPQRQGQPLKRFSAVQFGPRVPRNSDDFGIGTLGTAKSGDRSPAGSNADEHAKRNGQASKGFKPLVIDLEGIADRVLAFPVADSRYGQIAGAPGRAIFTSFPVRGALDGEESWSEDENEYGTLRAWVYKDYKSEIIAEDVTSFDVSRNGKKLGYFSGKRLRVIATGEKAPSDSGPGRKSGWIDLSRIKVSVVPRREWEQMYREAWRLQRDHFWTEDMSEVDWNVVYDRYFPLIARVSSRSEFSDLLWEMQGELGTSHAYEIGGDYRPAPAYSQGALGTEFAWDPPNGGYRVGEIVAGDTWNSRATSPLLTPGADIRSGDVLVAINGQRLDAETGPTQLLVNQAGNEIMLTFAARDEEAVSEAGKPGGEMRHVVVRAGHSDTEARYRSWVESNRRVVHVATDGRIGYLHIPDMGPRGYAEFHRGFLAELTRDGLIVDVRYNGGGHVSQLLLEKLARRRLGYDQSRWSGIMPYPSESLAGPVVALTNEHAGSDGDIFCHSFKLLKLGPLIGKRTWGGVIGIAPRHLLVDGTMTTQPEYSFWFEDVGWMVENYGTDPDIEVDITPQDFVAGRDTQLEIAVQETLRLLAEQPVRQPDPTTRPSRALPKLPRIGD